ncbi:MAG: hypothetical protein ACRBCL_09565 [Maritimibacter sp.]
MTVLNNMSVLAGGAIALSGCMAVPFPTEISREISIEGSEFVYSLEDEVFEDDLNGRSGTATYVGVGLVAGATDEIEDRAILGDTSLDLNFDKATMTAEMTNLEAYRLPAEQVAAIEDGTLDSRDVEWDVESIPGRVEVRNGIIWGESMGGDVSATLTGHGIEFVISGGVIGRFLESGTWFAQLDEGADFSFTADGVPLIDPRLSIGGNEVVTSP